MFSSGHAMMSGQFVHYTDPAFEDVDIEFAWGI